jgi:hypothetical protein
MLMWERYGFNKKCVRIQHFKLVFLHLVGSVGHIVHSGASRAQNVDALFFMLAELVSLHPVGPAGPVVHSGASRARNIGAQFFMFGWDQCGFHKKHGGTPYAELLFLIRMDLRVT